MIARYGPCIGVTLFRFFRWKTELWWAPASYTPPEHTHENSDGEFKVLWSKGRRIFRRINGVTQHYVAKSWSKWYSVRAGTEHGFGVGKSCMIWLCVEHWKPGVKVTSVAKDFKLT